MSEDSESYRANRNNSVTMSESDALINKSVSEPSWPGLRNFPDVFENTIRPCLAEFIGVAVFVFIGTTAVCSGSLEVEGVALAHGLTIAVLVTAFGSISGGHFNPAVTLGVLLAGDITPIKALLYFVSQIIGSILGAAFTLGSVGNAYGVNFGGGHILPDHTYPGQAVLCELVLTFLLVTTVLVAAVDSSTKSSLGPLAIGFVVAVDILAGANVSGASMNPARSFGPAVVVHSSKVWAYHWIYWVGPALGSFAAGIIYRLILAGPEKRIFTRVPHLSH